MREQPEEMPYICKKDKVNQSQRIWESKYKTTIIKFEELKDKCKEMEKEEKAVERKYVSIKEVCEQTKILSVQTKTKLKNFYQEKETSEEVKVIKALKSMTETKIDSVPDEELQIKQLQTNLENEKKLMKRMQEEKYQKQLEINTINQKLITIRQNYENYLKKVTKLQEDVKRIKKEREGEQKSLSAEIRNNCTN